jgi:hypothetical protein
MIQNLEESVEGDDGRRRFMDTKEVIDQVASGEEVPGGISIDGKICWGALECWRTPEALDN